MREVSYNHNAIQLIANTIIHTGYTLENIARKLELLSYQEKDFIEHISRHHAVIGISDMKKICKKTGAFGSSVNIIKKKKIMTDNIKIISVTRMPMDIQIFEESGIGNSCFMYFILVGRRYASRYIK